eukprot:763398-Hanusia_phi.AAC.2
MRQREGLDASREGLGAQELELEQVQQPQSPVPTPRHRHLRRRMTAEGGHLVPVPLQHRQNFPRPLAQKQQLVAPRPHQQTPSLVVPQQRRRHVRHGTDRSAWHGEGNALGVVEGGGGEVPVAHAAVASSRHKTTRGMQQQTDHSSSMRSSHGRRHARVLPEIDVSSCRAGRRRPVG